MNKLAKKLLLPICGALIAMLSISIIFNSYYIQRFLLNSYRNTLKEVSQALSSDSIDIKDLEFQYGVKILSVKNISDQDLLNDQIRTSLREKNVGFTKLWLWDDGYNRLLEKGEYIQIYSQDPMKYSLMLMYLLKIDEIYVITIHVPHTSQTISLINTTSLFIYLSVGILLIIFVIMQIKKIVQPISQLTNAAKNISSLQFTSVNIRTKDEVEELAKQFNLMSENLKNAHKSLERKNESMEELLSNVAHEIKTPLSLIRAYIRGIQDGLDDGSFLETILQQTTKVEGLTQKLLQITDIQENSLTKEYICISKLLFQIFDENHPLIKDLNLTLTVNIEPELTVFADEEKIRHALENIFVNAIKYSNSYLTLSLIKKTDSILLEVCNDIFPDTELDIDKLWEPFYVGEKSRAKSLSGNGLGLSIVKACFVRHDYPYGCILKDREICFWVKMF